MSSPAIALKNVSFAWGGHPPVLDIDRLECLPGERIFLQGMSGSGKSTLLNIVCGVFDSQDGELTILDSPFHRASASARDQIRADRMGVIFQQFNLVPFLSLVENVLLPCQFSAKRRAAVGETEKDRFDRAHELLDRLGLGKEAYAKRQATALSVGQQQRVAAARALIGEPDLVIADEPTSALDHATKDRFIETLLSEAGGATVLFVSHDPTLAPAFDRQINMADINRATPPAQVESAS